jgi:hypothetical protein
LHDTHSLLSKSPIHNTLSSPHSITNTSTFSFEDPLVYITDQSILVLDLIFLLPDLFSSFSEEEINP